MKRVLVDTSGWVALCNRRETRHADVARFFASWDGRLVTTNYVLDETITHCLRLGHPAAVKIGQVIRDPDVVDLVRVETRDEDAAWRLFAERSDKRYSFTDCTSFVIARRLGIDSVLTLDDDFRAEGFKVLPEA